MSVVYLLHFERPYPSGRRPRHYVGVARDLSERVAEHRRGSSKSRLMAAIHARGITFEVARVWEHEDAASAFSHERRVKRRRHHSRLCPLCSAKGTRQ